MRARKRTRGASRSVGCVLSLALMAAACGDGPSAPKTPSTPDTPAGAFDITLQYVSGTTRRQRESVDAAVARWRSAIQSDLPNTSVRASAGECFARQPALNETVDDLLLLIDFVAIDGVGRTLGEAGPCYVRTGSGLPVVGYLKLDADDLRAMASTGTLDDVVLHEIGHVLGIGTRWSSKGLLTGKGTDDPQFIGATALDEYHALGSVAPGVPVENMGGTGTRDGHWRESVFGNELMTGWVGSGSNPLSAMTIASLHDLGYGTSSSAASTYALSDVSLHSQAGEAGIDLRDRERLVSPRFAIDPFGRKQPIVDMLR
jgi:Leishmanolysin